jgi:hypothetical protein
MMMTLNNCVARRFNEAGMHKVRKRYSVIKGTKTLQLLNKEELFDDRYSERIGQADMTSYEGASRAGLLNLVAKQLGEQNVNNYTDIGMWTWMAAFHFDHLRSIKKDGTIKGDSLRIIMEPGWKWARHLIAGPMFLTNHEGPEWCPDPINSFPDWMEQLTQRQDALLIEGARKLYGNLYCKGGSWPSAGRHGPGSWREYPILIRQLQVTYCINSMTENQLKKVLPAAFYKRLSEEKN